jgi:hypothetical protein
MTTTAAPVLMSAFLPAVVVAAGSFVGSFFRVAGEPVEIPGLRPR